MRLYPISDVQEGMILGKSIYQVNGMLLLGAGYRISDKIKSQLLEKGYNYIYIMENETGNIIPEDIISEKVHLPEQTNPGDEIENGQNIDQFLEMTSSKAAQFLESGYFHTSGVTYEMRRKVNDTLKDISGTGSKNLLTLLTKSKDTLFFDHSLNTAILSTLIGTRYHFKKQELCSLALGSFLHDIGKIVIEQLYDDNNKMKELLYKEHPTFGCLLVKNRSEMNMAEAAVINQHHEYQDGSGFPIGLTGENIPPNKPDRNTAEVRISPLAEICCVANAFDNLVMNPSEKERFTPEEALKKLIANAGKIYNKNVVETLHDLMPIFPLGSTIQIEEIIEPILYGYYGIVVKINEKRHDRPVIILTMNNTRKKIKPIMIDTSKLHNIQLKLII
jgi:HD-GYP domain-containing protein (c-di-GMP phosphodiesterase class II)